MNAAVLCAVALVQSQRVEGTFVVQVDTLEVARERYVLSTARLATGNPGWTVTATSRYDRVQPPLVLAAGVELAADSQPTTVQFDVTIPGEPLRFLGQLGRDRFTVRTVSRSVERAREFPVQRPVVVLDDSVFALYQVAAWYARPNPVTLTAMIPRAYRRETLVSTDRGKDSTVLNRRPVNLRHVTLTGGVNALVHLWLDEQGRLVKLEIPSRDLVAEHVPSR